MTAVALIALAGCACLVLVIAWLFRELEHELDDHMDSLTSWRATIDGWKESKATADAREQQLLVILRHYGMAVEHAINGDHDAVRAVLSECTYGGEPE